jgi:ubiquinone/menaquinone biosynthesis C-methylase UbiE
MDALMRNPRFDQLRNEALQAASGEVLEIGFGTGLNLPHYPLEITRLVALEPNRSMQRRARVRIREHELPVEYLNGSAEAIPYPGHSFDTVVSTCTLCSVRDLADVLHEIRRVLRPHGRYLLLEHGLSPDPPVQRWQHWLTPINRRLGAGCHLNRDIAGSLRAHGFAFDKMRSFYLERGPKFTSYMTIARARPAEPAPGGAID